MKWKLKSFQSRRKKEEKRRYAEMKLLEIHLNSLLNILEIKDKNT